MSRLAHRRVARLIGMMLASVVLVAGDVRADYSVPVYVAVVGTGNVKLFVSAGSVVPCDSSSNTRLFDGWAAAGRTFVLQSPWSCVCETHTTGAFRETNYTPPQVVCQQINPASGMFYPYIALGISTE